MIVLPCRLPGGIPKPQNAPETYCMSWRIAEADLENIRSRIDLVALVRSRGVDLVQDATGDFSGRCPFHDDQSKNNFIVTTTTGMWHCQNCGRTGNVIQFVEQHDGVSFRHAFDLLRQGTTAVFSAQPLQKQSTVPKLPCPLDVEADEGAASNRVDARELQDPGGRAHGLRRLHRARRDDRATQRCACHVGFTQEELPPSIPL